MFAPSAKPARALAGLAILVVLMAACAESTATSSFPYNARIPVNVHFMKGDGSASAPLRIRFDISNTTTEFVLHEQHDFLAPGAKHTAVIDNQAVDVTVQQRWFHGYIVKQADSFVRLTLHPNKLFTCLARQADKWISIEIDEDTERMVSVNDHEEHFNITFDHAHSLIEQVAHKQDGLKVERQRRGAQISASYTQCPIFLDADARYFTQFAGPCAPTDTTAQCQARKINRVTVLMIDILHRTDGIYDNNFKGLLRLGLAGTAIQVTSNLNIPTPTEGTSIASGSVLSGYQYWLANGTTSGPNGLVLPLVRGAGQPNAQQVCLNHLLTYINCGSTLGVASTAGLNQLGGMCETTILGNGASNPYQVYNTAFSTRRSGSGIIPQLQSVLVSAHEIGHNFGASHDCSTDCTPGQVCVPTTTQGGVFIMYPSITNNLTAPNAQKFSSCSITSITQIYKAKGSCLIIPKACANGGACCDGTNFRAKGYQCRGSDFAYPCQGNAYCTGQDPYCPGNDILSDGSYCNTNPTAQGNSGQCLDDECAHPNLEFCDTYVATGNAPCSIPGSECVRACLSNGNCYAYEASCKLGAFYENDGQPCPYAPVGTPCTVGGLDGVCSGNATCIKCATVGCSFFQTTTTPPAPADCQCGPWTPFSACSLSCGNGATQSRTRTCTDSLGTGKTCAQLGLNSTQTQACSKPCPVDCILSTWSAWSACSVSCGAGVITRTRTITQQPANGGVPCSTILSNSTACQLSQCPVQTTLQLATTLANFSQTTFLNVMKQSLSDTSLVVSKAAREVSTSARRQVYVLVDLQSTKFASVDSFNAAVTTSNATIKAALNYMVTPFSSNPSPASSTGGGSASITPIIAGAAVGAVILLIIVLLVLWTRKPSQSLGTGSRSRSSTTGYKNAKLDVEMRSTSTVPIVQDQESSVTLQTSVDSRPPKASTTPAVRVAPPAPTKPAPSAPKIPTHTALYDFKADDETQVSLSEGCKVIVLDNAGDLWWFVELVNDHSTGYVPASYLKELKKPAPARPAPRPVTVAPAQVTEEAKPVQATQAIKAMPVQPVSTKISVSAPAPSKPASARSSVQDGPAGKPVVAPYSAASSRQSSQNQLDVPSISPTEPVTRYARALYAFDGSFQEGCITLNVGAEILLLRAEPGEPWWQGAYQTQIGSFPSAYVVEIPPPASAMLVISDTSPSVSARHSEAGVSLKSAPPTPRPSIAVSTSGQSAQNLSPTPANKPTVALAPPTATKPLQPSPAALSSTAAAPRRPSNTPAAWAEPTAATKVIKEDTLAESSTDDVEDTRASFDAVAHIAAQSSISRKGERFIALFDYKSPKDDDLSFAANDVITLLTTNTGNKGWWRGVHADGSVGDFPESYVKKFEESAPAPPVPTKPNPPSRPLPVPSSSATATAPTTAPKPKPPVPSKPSTAATTVTSPASRPAPAVAARPAPAPKPQPGNEPKPVRIVMAPQRMRPPSDSEPSDDEWDA